MTQPAIRRRKTTGTQRVRCRATAACPRATEPRRPRVVRSENRASTGPTAVPCIVRPGCARSRALVPVQTRHARHPAIAAAVSASQCRARPRSTVLRNAGRSVPRAPGRAIAARSRATAARAVAPSACKKATTARATLSAVPMRAIRRKATSAPWTRSPSAGRSARTARRAGARSAAERATMPSTDVIPVQVPLADPAAQFAPRAAIAATGPAWPAQRDSSSARRPS